MRVRLMWKKIKGCVVVMDVFETLVVGVPTVLILGIGAFFALRRLLRRGIGLVRLAIAALIMGCAFSGAYFWNMTVTPHLLTVELTEQQQELLSQMELPEQLKDLTASQKKRMP